jgi:septum formation protein
MMTQSRSDLPLILASRSPRRCELLAEAGYDFTVMPPDESAECGVCSGEPPPMLVSRLARQKAQDVARRIDRGMVIGCDTVVECQGQVLGKPADLEHARQMLLALRGRVHRVHSGVCLWRRPDDFVRINYATTVLRMDAVSDEQLQEYLDSGQWEGKAGAFGYQDRLGWIHVVEGSESNVVGLPLELLATMLEGFSAVPLYGAVPRPPR